MFTEQEIQYLFRCAWANMHDWYNADQEISPLARSVLLKLFLAGAKYESAGMEVQGIDYDELLLIYLKNKTK